MMRTWFARVVAVAAVTAVFGAPVAAFGGSPAPAAAKTNASPRVLWRLKLKGDYAPFPPVVAADGTIYVGMANGRLSAITPAGVVKWSVAGGAGPVSLGPDGTIYTVGGSSDVMAYNADGTRKWGFSTGGGSWLIAGPTVGPDGNIYAVENINGIGLFSLTPSGVLRFHNSQDRLTEYGGTGAAIAFDADHLYVAFDMYGVGAPSLFSYDLNGTRRFRVDGGDSVQPQPIVAPNGNIITRSFPIGTGISLGAVKPTGKLAWSFYEFPGNTQTDPAVAADNTVFVVRNLSTVYALNGDGTIKWKRFEPAILDTPTVSPGNDLLLMGGQVTYGEPGLIMALNMAGRTQWQVDLHDQPGFEPYGQVVPSASPTFSNDGNAAYVVADVRGDGASLHPYGFLYAIDTTT
jgi:PQQ-like domain